MGKTEILIFGVILLVFLGTKKMNELAKGLGESGKELKKAKRELEKAITDVETEIKT